MTGDARQRNGVSGAPALVGVAHGSRDPRAGRHIRALLRDVAARRPGLMARAAFIELTDPSVPRLLAELDRPAVVVPLLLARGYHVAVDVPRGAAARGDTATSAPLGPDPLLARVLADRLAAAEGDPYDAVVLGVAGSRDPAAGEDTARMAGWLAEELAVPVSVGYVAAARPTVAEAVAACRRGGCRRVAVASYVLAPGYFGERLTASGADVVTAPLSPHPALPELILRRYDAAAPAVGRPASAR
jgi:sirohydrochlorin ferrochelatase